MLFFTRSHLRHTWQHHNGCKLLQYRGCKITPARLNIRSHSKTPLPKMERKRLIKRRAHHTDTGQPLGGGHPGIPGLSASPSHFLAASVPAPKRGCQGLRSQIRPRQCICSIQTLVNMTPYMMMVKLHMQLQAWQARARIDR